MPKFSIIIPVYNVAPYLCECLDSILAQTFTDWEAICVDDGATDGSGAILDEYAECDSRFRVIHQANAGVSAARNVGMDIVRGEWFLFLDGDDMFRPDALEHFADVLAQEVCDAILMRPYVEWIPRECVVPTSRFKVVQHMQNGYHLMTEEISANGFSFGRVYRSDRFRNLRFKVGVSICEDLLFWSEAVKVSAAWVAAKGSYYFYRQREGSACRQYDFKRYGQVIEVVLTVIRDMASVDKKFVVEYWRRYRWSCEQIKDAFLLWGSLDLSDRLQLLSYPNSVRSICRDVPFSFDFRLAFGMHRAHLHGLYKPALLFMKIVRGVKRRVGCLLGGK